MRVTEVEFIPYSLPFTRPYMTARGTLAQREIALIRLVTDEGLVGLGEAVPLSLRGGADMAAVERGVRKAARRLRKAELSDFSGNDPLRSAIDVFIHTAAGRNLPAPAKAAIEMALFDLAGKAASTPVWRLLGAARAEPVVCNATLVGGAPAVVAADAERWAALGFRSFKLKLGTGDDVAQVRAVRVALGTAARIRVDANAAWSPAEATGVLKMIEPLVIELVEQPVAGLGEMAEITASTNVLVVADESVAGTKDAARAARTRACDAATVKLSKVGGIGEANGVAMHLPIYLSSALDGPVGIAASAHAAQALAFEGPAADLAHGLATQLLFSETIASRACELDGELLSLPDGPGLGVEIDTKALESHRIR